MAPLSLSSSSYGVGSIFNAFIVCHCCPALITVAIFVLVVSSLSALLLFFRRHRPRPRCFPCCRVRVSLVSVSASPCHRFVVILVLDQVLKVAVEEQGLGSHRC